VGLISAGTAQMEKMEQYLCPAIYFQFSVENVGVYLGKVSGEYPAQKI
jgi:hypothetical protein